MNSAIFISITAVILVIGIAAQSYTLHKCGFVQTMVYGKGAVWAAFGGYCDD